MGTRRNPRGNQLARGFMLGRLYERGAELTTRRICTEIGASRATAKRDMQVISTLVPTVRKVAIGRRDHPQRIAVKAAR